MESNESYYRRRAIQELAAARRAVTPHAWTRRRDLAATYLRRLAEITGIDESRQLETVAVYRGTENGSVHWRPPPTPDTPAGIPMPGIRRTIAGRSWILE